MPVVPIDQNRVAPAEGVSARLRTPDMSGTGLEAVGRGLQQVGQAGAVYAEGQFQIQDHANKLNSRDLGLQFQKVRDQIAREYGQLAGQDATNQGATYQQKLAEAKKEILDRAGNDGTKRYLTPMLDELELGGANYIADHSAKQLRVVQDSTYASGETLAQQSAVQYWDDPKLFKQHMDQGLQFIEQRAHLNGKDDPNTLAVRKLDFTSGVHSGVLDNMLAQPDPPIDTANAYFEKHRSEMSVAAQQSYLRAVQDPLQKRQDFDDLQHAIGGGIVAKSDAPSTQAALGTMRAITMASESGGNPNAVSVKGAVGTMQTMPGTLRDPGFGVRAAKDNSPAELERVGNDYLSAMMERYGNDPAKAWAAYNWGPGNLDKAMAEHGAAWLSAAPKETRDYVAKNLAQLGGGHTVETPREWDKDQVYNRIDATAEKEGWSFERTERVKRRADQVISRDEELLHRQESQADDKALDIVSNLGPGFTSMNQLGPLQGQLSTEARIRYQRMIEANTAPKPPQANSEEVVALHRMAVGADRAKFAQVDLRKYQPFMTPAEFDELAKDQARAQAELTQPKMADVRAKIDGAISRAKNWENVDTSKFPADEQFRIRNYMQLRAAEEANGGKALGDQDYARFFRDAVRQMPTGGWWKSQDRASAFLSGNMRTVIVNALKRNNVDPSEDNIQKYYARMGGQSE